MSAQTGGDGGKGGWKTKCGAGEGDLKNSQICADILYGRTHAGTTEHYPEHLRILSGGLRVRIPQELDVVAFWSWNLDVVVF